MKVKQILEEEIRKLEQELKIELPRELQRAAALGDLRENGEYQAARERQRYVQARLGALHQRLAALSMLNIDQLPRDRAAYGSTLEVLDLDRDTEITYRLVTPEEVDVPNGLISTTSPLGRCFMGKEEGDEVQAQTPQGVRRFEILKLRTIHDELAQ
ncbi:MAG: transcription elongation factor GreA [Acidobacteria bacterium]|nr:transcription elongation factor GreA [Acidobacteriota bacterium]